MSFASHQYHWGNRERVHHREWSSAMTWWEAILMTSLFRETGRRCVRHTCTCISLPLPSSHCSPPRPLALTCLLNYRCHNNHNYHTSQLHRRLLLLPLAVHRGLHLLQSPLYHSSSSDMDQCSPSSWRPLHGHHHHWMEGWSYSMPSVSCKMVLNVSA